MVTGASEHRSWNSINGIATVPLDWFKGPIVFTLITWVAEQKFHSWLTVNTDNLGVLLITHSTARGILICRLIFTCLSDISEDFKNSIVDWYLRDIREGEWVLNVTDGAFHSSTCQNLEKTV